MPAVDLSRFEVDPKILKLIPADFALKHVVLPLKREGRTLTVAMADPDQHRGARRPQVHHPVRPLPGHRRRVHPPQPHREALRVVRRAAADAPQGHGGAGRERRRGRRGAGGRGGDPGADRRRAGGEADQRPPDRRGEAGRLRHPHRAVRARDPGALPDRRRAAGSDEAAGQDEGGAHLAASRSCPSSTSPSGGCRRTAASSSRWATGSSTSASRRCRCIFGEKIVLRILDKGNLTLDLSKFGFEPKAEAGPDADHPEPLRHGAGDRPDRLGQDDDAVLRAVPGQHDRDQHHDGRGPGRVQPDGDQPGAGPQRDRADLRRGAEGVPAAGPEHHHDRGDPRPGDRRHRHQGGAHRPPGALHPAHQRRALDHHPHDRHGHRGRSTWPAPSTWWWRSGWCGGSARTARRRTPTPTRSSRPWATTSSEVKKMPFMKGTGCDTCSGTGYKGRAGLYEVMALSPRAAPPDPPRRRRWRRSGIRRWRKGCSPCAWTASRRSSGGSPRSKKWSRRRPHDGEPARAARGNDREGRLRPAHHRRGAAQAPHRRRHHQRLGAGRADPQGHAGAGLLGADREPEEAVRDRGRARLLLRHPEPGPLPRQRASSSAAAWPWSSG